MKKYLILISIIIFLSNVVFSQKQTRKLIESYYSGLDSCNILFSDDNYFIIDYHNSGIYFTFIFDGDNYINLLIEVKDSKRSQCIKYLNDVGFKEDKRSRTWSYDDKIAYLLWDWKGKKWYISVYLNENLEKI